MKDYKKIALELGQTLINKAPETRGDVERMLPELKESEDEKIRKAIIEAIKYVSYTVFLEIGIDYEDAVAWLEKQDRQKPDTDFSDLKTWKYIVDAVLTEKEGIGQYLDSPFTEEVAKKLQKRFGNIEQKPVEWSEEDENLLSHALTNTYTVDVAANLLSKFKSIRPQQKQTLDESVVRSIIDEYDEEKESYSGTIKKLCSLRPQSHWKPSDEQVHSLQIFIEHYPDYVYHEGLESLYKDLKTL